MRKTKLFLIRFGILFPLVLTAQNINQKLGLFENNSDIGNVKHARTATYAPSSQQYELKGSGTNIWFNNDEFHYLWKKLKGDFILTAQVEFVGEGVEPHRKIGWMVRESFL